MIITKRHTESTEDKTIFSGKIEIETDSIAEWKMINKTLSGLGAYEESETVAHCNLKENAELIANILDFDCAGKDFTATAAKGG